METIKFKTVLFLFLLSIFSSCSEDFLENPPLTTITDETFPISESDALLVTNAAYSNLRNWWIMGGYPLAGIMSDDQTKGSEDGSNPDLQNFEEFSFTPSHGYILAWFQALYQSVYHANIVIEKIPPIEMDDDLKSRYIAEARFLRAYTYFTLVRLWGDLPKVTTVNPELYLERSPASEIYEDIIIPDLEHAAGILPEKSEYDSEDMGRITRGAAKALLARVYLTLGDYENTEKYALEVITSGQYSLDPDWSNVFSKAGEFGTGSIFELGALPEGRSLGGNQYGNTQGVRGTPNWGWGFGRPSWDYINSFEDGDPRLDGSVIFLGETIAGTLIEGNNNTSDTTYNSEGEIIEIECYNQKVSVEDADGTEDNYGHNRRLIRLADVKLMAAEALNENDKPGLALVHLNDVRERARGGDETILPDIEETDKDLLREIIWKERRAELAFENIRYYDLKRQGRMTEILGDLGFTEDLNELLPVPQQEIDLSGNTWIQNPNWENQ